MLRALQSQGRAEQRRQEEEEGEARAGRGAAGGAGTANIEELLNQTLKGISSLKHL